MGISLSNKDYIAFTIKSHDYDAIADCNKTMIIIIKGGKKGEEMTGNDRNGKRNSVERRERRTEGWEMADGKQRDGSSCARACTRACLSKI